MTQAKRGDTVRVHYTGKLEDGTVFDSSLERDPLEFTIGAGQVIPGFEEAVVGLSPGQSVTATVPAEEAYGPHREEMVIPVERDRLPEDLALEVGLQLQVRQADGSVLIVTVTDLSDETVVLDANHPLAGKDLTFDIQLVEIL